jgi:hypothetical protein
LIPVSLKKLNAQKKVAEDDSDDDDQYLPDTDQNSTAGNDSDMQISPALRALMAKLSFLGLRLN